MAKKKRPGRVTPGKPKKRVFADEFDLDAEKAEYVQEALANRKAFKYMDREWLLVPYLKATSANLDAMTIDGSGNVIIVPPSDDAGESKVRDWVQAAFRQVIDEIDYDDFVLAIWGDEDDIEDHDEDCKKDCGHKLGDPDMPQETLMSLVEWCGAQVSGEPEDPS